jgi:hypothetical protein
MIAAGGPRFDESLSSVVRGLHVGEVAFASVVAACLLFAWLERRGRRQWARVPMATFVASARPYRASEVISEHLTRAPRIVRLVAFSGLAFGHMFIPLILLALLSYPFDGIAIPLIPGIALALLNWVCAWLLLGRSPNASQAARLAAVGSLMSNVGLLVMSVAHLVGVELQRRDGIQHACSTSVTLVVIVFATSSIALAGVMLRALRTCRRELEWADSRQPSIGARVPPMTVRDAVVDDEVVFGLEQEAELTRPRHGSR